MKRDMEKEGRTRGEVGEKVRAGGLCRLPGLVGQTVFINETFSDVTISRSWPVP